MRNILFVFAAFASACGYQLQRVTDVEVPAGNIAVEVSDDVSAEGEYEPEDLALAPEPEVQPEARPSCPITIERSSADRDVRPAHPLAFGVEWALIGEYFVRASCEDVDIIHVILHDRVGGEDTAADFFENLRVVDEWHDDRRTHFVGAQVSRLTDRFDQPYWFTPASPIRVRASFVQLLAHFVDVKSMLTGDESSVNGLAPFSVEVVAVGRESGERMKAELTDLPVVYLGRSGSLRVETYTPLPEDGAVRCGSHRSVAGLTLTAGPYELVMVTGIRMKLLTGGNPRVLQNFHLVYGGSDFVLCDWVEAADAVGYVTLRCPGGIWIEPGYSVGLALHADVAVPDGSDPSAFYFILGGEHDDWLVTDVVAMGMDSGAFIMGEELRFGNGEEDELLQTASYTISCH